MKALICFQLFGFSLDLIAEPEWAGSDIQVTGGGVIGSYHATSWGGGVAVSNACLHLCCLIMGVEQLICLTSSI